MQKIHYNNLEKTVLQIEYYRQAGFVLQYVWRHFPGRSFPAGLHSWRKWLAELFQNIQTRLRYSYLQIILSQTKDNWIHIFLTT